MEEDDTKEEGRLAIKPSDEKVKLAQDCRARGLSTSGRSAKKLRNRLSKPTNNDLRPRPKKWNRYNSACDEAILENKVKVYRSINAAARPSYRVYFSPILPKDHVHSSSAMKRTKLEAKEEEKVERFAIVIGNDDYKDSRLSKLSCCNKNVDAMEKKLKGLGYTVEGGRDQTISSIQKLFTKLKASFFTADTPKKFVFYFTGHGNSIDGASKIYSTDGFSFDVQSMVDDFVLRSNLFPHRALDTFFIVLDTCRTPTMSDLPVLPRPVVVPRANIAVMYSCAQGKQAVAAVDKATVYTEALVDSLDNTSDIASVARRVNFKVLHVQTANGVESDNLQRPWFEETLAIDAVDHAFTF